MNRNLFSAGAVLLTLLATGCKESVEQQQSQQTTYKLQTLKSQTSQTTASYTAAIRGKQDIEIFPQVGGYLNQILVNEGEKVKAGQTLFVIEQAPFLAAYKAAKAQVEMAKAALATAELNYNNTSKLRTKDIVGDADLQAKENALASAKASLAMAEAQMLSAKANLDFTVIKSPSNGVVSTIPYRKGALVSAALMKSLTVVSDNSEMYVYFSMSENQMLDLIDQYGNIDNVVAKMPEIELELNNGTIYAEKGKVESISGSIDPTTGAVSLRAVFPNPDFRLLSGGVGNVLITNDIANTIIIPKTATFEIQDKTYVYCVEDNKAVASMIDVNKSINDKEFIVTSGLEAGDVIIAEGAGLVREGAPVNQ